MNTSAFWSLLATLCNLGMTVLASLDVIQYSTISGAPGIEGSLNPLLTSKTLDQLAAAQLHELQQSRNIYIVVYEPNLQEKLLQ
jgi:hypothetical protein